MFIITQEMFLQLHLSWLTEHVYVFKTIIRSYIKTIVWKTKIRKLLQGWKVHVLMK